MLRDAIRTALLIDRNRIQLRILARRKVNDNDLLAIGRPARLHGIERRVAELESLAAVQFGGPECSLREVHIGHPLPISMRIDGWRICGAGWRFCKMAESCR